MVRQRARVRVAALVAAVAATLCLGGCDDVPHALPGSGTLSFTVSGPGYVVGPVLFQTADAELFGADDIVGTGAGYLLTDSRNDRLMIYDRQLALVHQVGQTGSGPGEYQFPTALASGGDRVAVLDQNLARVSYLTPTGEFMSSQQVRNNPSDLALHPRLGLLVVENASPVHYLNRYDVGEPNVFGEMPTWLAGDSEGAFRLRQDLVAVTPDGSVHVLDSRQLVLVSYAESGAFDQAAFLPEQMRKGVIDRRNGLVGEFGGPGRVFGYQAASQLQPLPDGRLFVRITWGRVIGYVLDPGSLEAEPVVVPAGRGLDWMSGSSVYLEGERQLRIFAALDEEMAIAPLVSAQES